MIISILVVDLHTSTKLYRSSSPMFSSKMNYYLTEFNSLATNSEGFLEKQTYNYVYVSNNVQKIGMQVTKDHSSKQAASLLKHIEQNSTEDIFDMLFTIDNTFFGGVGIKLDLQPIKEMDSQEEKIYKMMIENKRLEMKQREKTERMRELNEQMLPQAEKPVTVVKPKKIERSAQPVLLLIKEKAKLVIDRENRIKENFLNGEVNLVISDAKYRQLQIKMKNLKSTLQYSPYLDKNAMKKQILRFERDRGLNKSIPLLKWTGKCTEAPLHLEFWSDEDEGKIVNMIEYKALRDLKEVEFKFSKEAITELEIEEAYEEVYEEDEETITWRSTDIKKGETRNFEIKCVAFDKDFIFPIEIKLLSGEVETNLNVEKMVVDENEIQEFEVRKILEMDDFTVNAE